jgi:hypothetical protein
MANFLADDDGSSSGGEHPPCQTIAGVFSYFVQFMCAVLAILSLVVKRHREDPQRPWKIWAMDSSKQITSGLAAHFAGNINAIILARAAEKGNQCSWYLISFSVDTSLGAFELLLTVHVVVGCDSSPNVAASNRRLHFFWVTQITHGDCISRKLEVSGQSLRHFRGSIRLFDVRN